MPHIRTGTNGFLFRDHARAGFADDMRRLAETLAGTRLSTFWISIDSADPDTHESMRGLPGVIRGIEKALPVFESFGIYPSANLGINRNTGLKPIRGIRDGNDPGEHDRVYDDFRQAFRSFYRFVREMGFTIVNSCYPMSVDSRDGDLSAVYAASSADDVISFTPVEKTASYPGVVRHNPPNTGKYCVFSRREARCIP